MVRPFEDGFCDEKKKRFSSESHSRNFCSFSIEIKKNKFKWTKKMRQFSLRQQILLMKFRHHYQHLLH